MENLDDPARVTEIRSLIERKRALKQFYVEIYKKFRASLLLCSTSGVSQGGVLELGSGGGFAKEFLPEIVTSDVIPYQGIDRVVDATAMPFLNDSLRFICMINTLHHVPDVEKFFTEADRCLQTGGRVFIVDQFPCWISYAIYRWAHHEPFDDSASEWKFPSMSRLGDANGALAWIVFCRDRKKFEARFPRLQVKRVTPHTPLLYWLAGGLKNWCLLPNWSVRSVGVLDRWLCVLSPNFGSFVDIELEKVT